MAFCRHCGTALRPDSHYCPNCGESVRMEDPVIVQTSTEGSKSSTSQVTSSLIGFVIFLILGCIMAFTCPDKDAHVEAINTEIMNFVENEGDEEAQAYAILGSGIINKALKSKLKVDNYVLFSLGKFHLKKEDKIVSVGVFGRVFTGKINKENLREAFDKLDNGFGN